MCGISIYKSASSAICCLLRERIVHSMTGLINLIIRQITRIIWKNNNFKHTNVSCAVNIPNYVHLKHFQHSTRIWYSTSNTANVVSEEQIKTILNKRFSNAVDIKVEDVSGGCGAMFDIYVEAPEFKGLSVVKQHKSVYEALKDEIKQIHGLHLTTKAPS